jgi:hypothetical protein
VRKGVKVCETSPTHFNLMPACDEEAVTKMAQLIFTDQNYV